MTTLADIRLDFAWLPEDAIQAYFDAYVETGDSARAWVKLRQDSRYEDWFPGNLTADGRPKYSEDLYANTIAQYDDVMQSVGLGDFYRSRYGEWIAGDVTPKEAESRVLPGFERIVSQSDALKQAYADYNGIEMSDAALLISFLDPAMGEEIVMKNISIAEIGGEGYESGFNVTQELATRMFEEGSDMSRLKAESVFQQAETFVPVLSVLANRHADPDDEFDLENFVAADLFADPVQRRRMNRLMAQESASFTGGRQTTNVVSSKTGGISGLDEL